MAGERVRWIELDDLHKALENLAADARAAADPIVRRNAYAAEAAVKAAYPHRTGHLRDEMGTQDFQTGPYGVAVLVYNTAEYAGWFEYGTQARHTGKSGANRGPMPPGRVFRPITRRCQQTMVNELADMVESMGATVRNGRG